MRGCMAVETDARASTDLLRALANPQRLTILCALAAGESSVGDLRTRIALTQSALSQHLARLRAHHLVATRRQAQTIYYRIDDEEALALARALLGLAETRAGGVHDRLP